VDDNVYVLIIKWIRRSIQKKIGEAWASEVHNFDNGFDRIECVKRVSRNVEGAITSL